MAKIIPLIILVAAMASCDSIPTAAEKTEAGD